jgi:acyl-CoA thioesterase-2
MGGQPRNEAVLSQLLTLERIASHRWRSRYGDPNANGRVYGGQLLGQAMMAAQSGIALDRAPTMMQALFLQGAVPDDAVEFEVATLQEGKRFSSRRVSASQGNGRSVLEAQITCAATLDGPRHSEPSPVPAGERPESLPSPSDLPKAMFDLIGRLGGYSQDCKPAVEFRIPEPMQQLSPQTCGAHFRYWMRAAQPLPHDRRIHAAAFAYLSDWWLNFSALALHLRTIGPRQLYISSLNHGLWLHQAVRADEWLHVETVSPASNAGCGVSIAKIHDVEGNMVASATQQLLMVFAD